MFVLELLVSELTDADVGDTFSVDLTGDFVFGSFSEEFLKEEVLFLPELVLLVVKACASFTEELLLVLLLLVVSLNGAAVVFLGTPVEGANVGFADSIDDELP